MNVVSCLWTSTRTTWESNLALLAKGVIKTAKHMYHMSYIWCENLSVSNPGS